MKKLIAVLLIAFAVLAFAGCSRLNFDRSNPEATAPAEETAIPDCC